MRLIGRSCCPWVELESPQTELIIGLQLAVAVAYTTVSVRNVRLLTLLALIHLHFLALLYHILVDLVTFLVLI